MKMMMMMAGTALASSLLLLPPSGALLAQTETMDDPAPRPHSAQELAELVMDRLVNADLAAYQAVFPFEPILKRQVGQWGVELEADPPRILRATADSALLLLGARPRIGNLGDETVVARTFSGLYVARRDGTTWRLTEQIPADAGNRIRHQTLQVRLDPDRGLDIVDTLTIEVEGGHGFGVHLNRTARLHSARVDGDAVKHEFAGGYLWLDAPRGSTELVLDYHLPVAVDTLGSANSGRFGPDAGHVRNQYMWHPFFDFNSEADRATYRITVRAPERFHVVTSIPQEDQVIEGVRVVRGRTSAPTFALTLIYDAGVERTATPLGPDATLELLLPPDSDPPADSISASVRRTYRVLTERFGPPGSPYLAIAPNRMRGGGGWNYRSNDLIATGARPGLIDRDGPMPRAWLGHEVSHGWTRPTGPATNFLSEGWANFAESVLIRERYGPAAEADYWESQRAVYGSRGYDGEARLASDPFNSGVSYYKGSYVLRMLRDHVGTDTFQRGFRDYMAIPPGEPAGLEEFVAAMSAAAGHDVGSFLRPWIEETVIPDLHATFEDGVVIVEQRQDPLFRLDVDVEIAHDGGTVRRSLRVDDRVDTLAVADLPEVERVRLDPDHRLLVRRHWGDTITFSIEAPEASSVVLNGTFGNNIPAERNEDGTWTVQRVLTEGTYGHWWEVDGDFREPEEGQRLIVRPVVPVSHDALP